MDFYRIRQRSTKGGDIELVPDFQIVESRDLMVQGKAFYAIWNEQTGLWSTNEYDVCRLVDKDLDREASLLSSAEKNFYGKHLGDFSSKVWLDYRSWVGHISDNSHTLDMNLTFKNTPVRKEDYASRRLPYDLEQGDISAWDELIGTLYEPEERQKLEWAIGAVVSGDSKDIQKFLVLYGSAGTGKSTVLNIIQKLFSGYYTTFEAKALAGNNNSFATEAFRTNPLVAIQHDGDLSKIEDNTKLNSIISHEEMTMNEKFKPSYTARSNAFLFMGTNKPVMITDANSGIIRRLIDVTPTGKRIPPKKYSSLMTEVNEELGAIAKHCLDVYLSLGKNFYNGYQPLSMMYKTDVFFNFIEEISPELIREDAISLKRAYELYKAYCEETNIQKHILPRYEFREQLKEYFEQFHDKYKVDEKSVRNYYTGFKSEKLHQGERVAEPEKPYSLVLDLSESIIDDLYKSQPAQYSNEDGIPSRKWEYVTTTLSDIDTQKEHYVKLPVGHIVIDFDLKNEDGSKSMEKNLEAASKWPPTYGEFSKSGSGVHLHYIYDGDPSELSYVYDENIEVKAFTGNASLRRKLSFCNNVPVAHISTGLPLKEKKVLNTDRVKSEKALRDLVERNLRKEIHPGTKPSIDFIKKILDDAYSDGLVYDLTNLRPKVMAFANNSSHQAEYCLKLVTEMHFASEQPEYPDSPIVGFPNDDIIFYDCEVFPNLFLVNWKKRGVDGVVRMINPTGAEIESLVEMRLVGFNNRNYDDHILYARYMGYDNKQLYDLSQRIINNSPNSHFGEAYNLSYTDIYDFSNTKMSLKKWEISLGIHHQELGLPWDKPVPEEKWEEVAKYCDNDVIATEAVFEHIQEDWIARQVLAAIAGLPVNSTTNQLTAKIIFQNDKSPQSKFIYTDLSTGKEYAWPDKPQR